MPDLFKDIPESNLFRNEIALDINFTPKKIQFRETENEYIASCIKPLFQKRSGKNLLIYGCPGIGKTLACKLVLNELEEVGLLKRQRYKGKLDKTSLTSKFFNAYNKIHTMIINNSELQFVPKFNLTLK